jgi:phospholipid transport system substrate-binding protein
MRLIKLSLILLIVLPCSLNCLELDKKSPESFVLNTSEKVIALLRSKIPASEKHEGLCRIFLEVMDVEWIGKFALGHYWQPLSSEERKAYLNAYKKYLANNYVSKLKEFNNQKVIIKSVKKLDDGQYMMTTEIQAPDANTKVEYRIKETNSGYKIRDIIAEGVSLLNTERSEFGSALNSKDIYALNDLLHAKITEGEGEPN